MAQKLFQGVAINATSGSWVKPDMDLLTVFAWGVFNGAQVKIEFSPDGEEWFEDPIGELTFDAKAIRTQRVSVGVHIRAVITSAGASTNLNLWVL